MISQRFSIFNRESLLMDRAILPLVQHVARAIHASGVVRRFASCESIPTDPGWIIFRGQCDRGFGVKVDENVSHVSPLQRALEYVRSAETIVRSFGGPRSFPFELSLERSPPAEWRTVKVEGLTGALWCACSIPVVELPLRCVAPQRDPLVRIRLVCVAEGIESLEIGSRVVCEKFAVRMPEIGIRAHGVCRGGEMAIEVDECGIVEEQQIPGVRLDLGEVEMRLSDLVGLRPGAVLHLGEVVLERCFIRLGATVLAEGKFTTTEGKLLLTIDSVL